jgi:hypothetical protein
MNASGKRKRVRNLNGRKANFPSQHSAPRAFAQVRRSLSQGSFQRRVVPLRMRRRLSFESFPAHHIIKGHHVLQKEPSAEPQRPLKSHWQGALACEIPVVQGCPWPALRVNLVCFGNGSFHKTGTPRLSSSALRTRMVYTMDAFRGDSGVWACTGKRL